MRQADLNTAEESPDAEEQPLCLRCLAPIRPLQHYCEKCGEAVGRFTPYIPFVNIRFNFSIFDKLWHRLWYDRERSIMSKAFYLLLIIATVPIMLVGLPFLLWAKIRSHTRSAGP